MEISLNKNILAADVQEYIEAHLNEEITAIALRKSPFEGVSSAELATQIDVKKRSQKKLPLWYSSRNIYFPPRLNMEQCSSEATALYKSKLAKGSRIADLTGGFGVDTFYFAKQADEVFHIEQNATLSAIATHNAKTLGANNIQFYATNGVNFLKESTLSFDTIYLDPGRRIANKKVFLIKDTEPNVIELLPFLLTKSKRVIIKTSPLVDIQSGLSELQHVCEVHVISLKNDCKELLWIIDPEFIGQPNIKSVSLSTNEEKIFSFSLEDEKTLTFENHSKPLKYLYDPDVALLKAGCFKSLALYYNLKKLHKHTHLYTSSELNKSFQGRIFEVEEIVKYSSRNITQGRYNIISRNFPLSVEEIKKKHKLTEGGSDFMIFCTVLEEERLIIKAKRIL